MIKLGIVSVESTHVDAFCRIFNSDSSDPWNLEGAQIVALCTQDNAPERVAQLQETHNIETVVTEPRDLAPMVDAAMVLGRDGSRHLEQAAPFLEAGKPCFVDKPMAHTVDDATALVNLAVDNPRRTLLLWHPPHGHHQRGDGPRRAVRVEPGRDGL